MHIPAYISGICPKYSSVKSAQDGEKAGYAHLKAFLQTNLLSDSLCLCLENMQETEDTINHEIGAIFINGANCWLLHNNGCLTPENQFTCNE